MLHLSETTAILFVAGIVVLTAIVATVIVRLRTRREMERAVEAELVRECSNCGRMLPKAATSCPKCGSDMTIVIG